MTSKDCCIMKVLAETHWMQCPLTNDEVQAEGAKGESDLAGSTECFSFKTSRASGSLPPAQEISIISKPIEADSDEHTAAWASLILSKGTRAVANLGGFVGAFFGGFIERSIEDSSTGPKRMSNVFKDDGVIRFGYLARGYFRRTVVSKGSEKVGARS